jgi:arsenate reductase-like glutaredoxin family protein
MIENEPNELTLIYHSDKDQDKKARAFVETITHYKVKTLDLKKESLTETQLAEIANKMGTTIRNLADPSYADRLESKDVNTINEVYDNDLLTILTHEPILINTPIAIIGKRAYSYASAYDLLNKNTSTDGISDVADANKEEKRN